MLVKPKHVSSKNLQHLKHTLCQNGTFQNYSHLILMIFNQNTLCFLCDILTHFDELDLGTPFASKMNVKFRYGRRLEPNTFPLDWQDSRISRGNGKWICGKIPAGNEVREIAGKICQFWPKNGPKLVIIWPRICL